MSLITYMCQIVFVLNAAERGVFRINGLVRKQR